MATSGRQPGSSAASRVRLQDRREGNGGLHQRRDDRAFIQKIRNLGFGAQGDSDAFAIRKFQSVHKKLKRTGKLDDDTKQAVRDLDDKRLRDWFDDEPRAAS